MSNKRSKKLSGSIASALRARRLAEIFQVTYISEERLDKITPMKEVPRVLRRKRKGRF